MKRILYSPMAKLLFVALTLLVLAACAQGDPPPVDDDGTNANLTVSVTGNGSVTSAPAGIDCTGAGSDCAHTYGVDTDVTLTAAADAGSTFAGWGGACADATGNTCALTLTANTSVSATFQSDDPANGTTETYSVAAAGADVEELQSDSGQDAMRYPAGHTYAESSDLELVFDPDHASLQQVGLRFDGVAIPADATIVEAMLVFTATGEGTAGPVTVQIAGESNAAPAPFEDDADAVGSSDVSSRTSTSATTAWEITDAWTAGSEQASADIAAVVQEIIALEGWTSGNSMVFMLSGDNATDYRAAQSAGTARTAPQLVITYTVPAAE